MNKFCIGFSSSFKRGIENNSVLKLCCGPAWHSALFVQLESHTSVFIWPTEGVGFKIMFFQSVFCAWKFQFFYNVEVTGLDCLCLPSTKTLMNSALISITFAVELRLLDCANPSEHSSWKHTLNAQAFCFSHCDVLSRCSLCLLSSAVGALLLVSWCKFITNTVWACLSVLNWRKPFLYIVY